MIYNDLNGKTVHGFRFISSREIKEMDAVLHLAKYEKNGAELAFLERADSNKTFAITFKTIPEDDTGVFHILEHSVLCGSRKYPVKEPFVELLKTSLKTFLNAFTFPDKTMYPLSSRNEKDFLNLINVYMDAVLYPRAITDKNVFLQEGWHFEAENEGSDLTYNGVVYNEMKGAYSSADEVEIEKITKLLYKGSCYAHDSGGDPLFIPTLTYEDFVKAHATYYHPSNSRIFLDGEVDLDSTLALLDSYLCDFDYLAVRADTGLSEMRSGIRNDIEYEIAESDDADTMTRVCLGYYLGSFDEIKKNVAFSVITDCIAGSNEGAFKKAMLDSGLCEDAYFFPYDGVRENSILLEIKNVREENTEAAIKLATDTIGKIVKDGIDRNALEASLNMLEFRTREQDTGSYPKGIANAISALNTWLYGGDPMLGLEYESVLSELREAQHTDYYERLLESVILKSEHNATLVMHPSKTLGEQRAQDERERLEKEKQSLSSEDMKRIVSEAAELHRIQGAPDTKEQLRTLPTLSINDIDKEPERIPTVTYEQDGTAVIYTKAQTSGITYMNMLFNACDLSGTELFTLSVITDLLCSVKTGSHSALELQTLIKGNIGALSFATTVLTRDGTATPYIKLSLSYLHSKEDVALALVREIITESDFSDTASLGKILKQMKSAAFESICSAGHSAAFNRAGAYIFSEYAISEYTDGIEFYKLLKDLDLNFEAKCEEFKIELQRICKLIFTKERLTLAYSGKEDLALPKKVQELLPNGDKVPTPRTIDPLGKLNEGIVIPSGVSYAVRAGNIFSGKDTGSDHSIDGSLSVARAILSYGYLWNTVRVIGGAYGSGLLLRKNGMLGFYSYRDPNAAGTLDAYLDAPDALRSFAREEDDLTGFIIGAIGDSDVLLTPKNIGTVGMVLALTGESYEKRLARRAQMLSTDNEALLTAADTVEHILKENVLCVIGGKDKISLLGDKIKNTVEL